VAAIEGTTCLAAGRGSSRYSVTPWARTPACAVTYLRPTVTIGRAANARYARPMSVPAIVACGCGTRAIASCWQCWAAEFGAIPVRTQAAAGQGPIG
jgi:hypothetical protein